jgi:hypothetical protein
LTKNVRNQREKKSAKAAREIFGHFRTWGLRRSAKFLQQYQSPAQPLSYLVYPF